jgi:hypothetical protein
MHATDNSTVENTCSSYTLSRTTHPCANPPPRIPPLNILRRGEFASSCCRQVATSRLIPERLRSVSLRAAGSDGNRACVPRVPGAHKNGDVGGLPCYAHGAAQLPPVLLSASAKVSRCNSIGPGAHLNQLPHCGSLRLATWAPHAIQHIARA